MIYQIAIEEVIKATSASPERVTILVAPKSVSADSPMEAILKLGAEEAERVSKSKADELRVTCKNF